jgi:vancomycin permeability regulator SanA
MIMNKSESSLKLKKKMLIFGNFNWRLIFNLNNVFMLKGLVLLILILITPFLGFTLNTFGLSKESDRSNPQIALILGAGVNKNGEPSWILKSRLETGLELYRSGKVKVLLVSGDNRFENYNEPKVMREYLENQGVNPKDIVEDFAGRRTLDSCWRAKNVFKASSIYIVTQAFHMPRSEFLCQSVGLQTKSAVALDGIPATIINGVIRESPASVLAIYETIFDKTAQIKADGTEKDLSQL